MSIVRCLTDGCPYRVRPGLRRDGHDLRFSGVKEPADGLRCWRCRAGRTKHLRPGRERICPLCGGGGTVREAGTRRLSFCNCPAGTAAHDRAFGGPRPPIVDERRNVDGKSTLHVGPNPSRFIKEK